jgi:tetratricopeptide (TPR) repeat protein
VARKSAQPDATGRRRRWWLPLVIALAATAVVVAVAALAPGLYRSWKYGRVDPPSPDPAGLEPGLAARIGRARAAVLADPLSAGRWGDFGSVCLVHDLHQEAIACFERAEQLDGDDFRWPYFLGLSRRIGDQRSALRAFERAARLRSDHPPLHVYLGLGHLALDDLDRAEASFRRATELSATLVRARLGLGQVALARGDPALAVEHLQQAVALGPQKGEPHRLLAAAHRALGDRAAADEQLVLAGEGVALEPVVDPIRDALNAAFGATMRWRLVRSREHLARGEVELARAEWKEAIRDDPDAAEPFVQLAWVEAGSGRYDEAVSALERALQLDGQQHVVRSNLGALLVGQGQWEEGLEHLRQASDALPEEVEVHLNLARALRTADRWEEAAEACARALTLDGEDTAARFEYGLVLAGLDRPGEAAEMFGQVVDADPGHKAAINNLANELWKMLRYEAAIDAMRRGIERHPGDRELGNNLAWRLATCPDPKLRDGAEAVRIVEPASRLTGHRDPIVLDTLGAAYAEVGQFEWAINCGQRAIGLISTNPAPPGFDRDSLLASIQRRLEGYRRGEAWRE